MKKYELVLFDLDGTLLDTSPGIYSSVRYAEQNMGLKPIDDKCLSSFVGPPPKLMYQKLYGLNDEDATKATLLHRKYGRTKAIYEATVYNGLETVLLKLKKCGYKLGVATLKSQAISEIILRHYGLFRLFDIVVGMDPDESYTKKRTIRICQERLSVNGKTVLIGDSQYDYEGALSAGIDFIGALYGFGFDKDKEYPFRSIRDISELLKLL